MSMLEANAHGITMCKTHGKLLRSSIDRINERRRMNSRTHEERLSRVVSSNHLRGDRKVQSRDEVEMRGPRSRTDGALDPPLALV